MTISFAISNSCFSRMMMLRLFRFATRNNFSRLVIMLTILASAPELNAQDGQTTLSGQVDLPRLIDICAARLNLTIDYDATTMKGTVTIRSCPALSDEQLWELTNRVLYTRGFTIVQLSGAAEDNLTVVKLNDAAALARIERSGISASRAGFVTVLTSINYLPTKSIIDAAKLILSKPGGSIADLGPSNMLLISDVRPKIEEVLELVRNLDVPGVEPVAERVELQHVSASQMLPLVNSAIAASDAMSPTGHKGKLIAGFDPNVLIVMSPPSELEFWKDVIDRFDRRQPVLTKSYSLRQFGADEIAHLIEQTGKDNSPRGSGDQWRVVADEITGTVTITATSSEHERIAELMNRLEALPEEARRPTRMFVIHNRSVREILDILADLLNEGVLAPDPGLEGAEKKMSATAGQSTLAMASSANGIRTTVPDGTTSTIVSPNKVQRPVGRDRASSDTFRGVSSRAALLSADEGTNTIIATADSRVLNQLAEIIRKLDVRQPQVMIEVLIASLSDTQTLDLGVELRKLEISGATTISLSSLFGLGTPGSGLPGNGNVSAGKGFTGVVLSPGDFNVVLRALQTINRGRVLSLPKVLVNNNQQATLNSVLQQPFVSVNASDTIATTSFGGTDNAGTIITIKPQIAEGDHLVLQYTVSLSSFVGDSIDPTVPPPKQSNNLSSLVTIPDGYTVVVGGLEITNESNGVSQVPLLGSIPLIGEAFKNRSNTRSRTRFYVFIRSDVMRHEGFEELRYLSEQALDEAGLDSKFRGWPDVEPRIIR